LDNPRASAQLLDHFSKQRAGARKAASVNALVAAFGLLISANTASSRDEKHQHNFSIK
jgi:hypothetical protein